MGSKYGFISILAVATIAFQLGFFLASGYWHEAEELSIRSVTTPFKFERPKLVQSSVRQAEPAALSADSAAAVDSHESVDIAVDSDKPSAPEMVEYRVSSGETLTRIWMKQGGTYSGALSAARALKSVGVSLNSIRAGEVIKLSHNGDGDITGLHKKIGEGKVLKLSGSSADGYRARLLEAQIVETKRSVGAIVRTSISAAAELNNIPYSVIDELVDLFGTRIVFSRDLQPGDSFTVIYNERQTTDGEDLSPGSIQAASIVNGGKMLAAVRHTGEDGRGHYYDETGDPLGNYFLRYPVRFSRISSLFSKNRFHPVLKRRRPHNGVDFAAPSGTPVRSVADGVIEIAGYRGGSGRMIKIRHGSRYQTAYLHLSRISSGIRSGVRVTRGQVIGKVGMTGLASGPHLHYSLYDRGRYVDPLKTKLPKMPDDQKPIPAEVLNAMLKVLEREHETVRIAFNAKISDKGSA